MSTTYKTYARPVKQGDSDALIAACKRWLTARVAFYGADNTKRRENHEALIAAETALEREVRRVT